MYRCLSNEILESGFFDELDSFVTEEIAHLANEIIFKDCEKVTTQLHHFESVKELIFGEDSAILGVPSDVRKRAQKIVEEAVEQTQVLKDMVQGKFNSWDIAYTCNRRGFSHLNS